MTTTHQKNSTRISLWINSDTEVRISLSALNKWTSLVSGDCVYQFICQGPLRTCSVNVRMFVMMKIYYNRERVDHHKSIVGLKCNIQTSMHSGRMCTAHQLTVSEWGLSAFWKGGVCLPRGIVGRQTPCEQTNTCENITFPRLRLRVVNIHLHLLLGYPDMDSDTSRSHSQSCPCTISLTNFYRPHR